MDILKEFRNRSELHKKSQLDEESRKKFLRDRYQNQVKPAMQAIMGYLDELMEHLKFVNHQIPFCFKIPGYGPVHLFVLDEHVVRTDSESSPCKITCSFECVGVEELDFQVHPKAAADETRKWLVSLRQQFTDWAVRGHQNQVIGLNFQLKLQLPVRIRFLADIETGRILMRYTNLNGLGTEELIINPERVDAGWLDKLGAFILKRNEDLLLLPLDEDQLDVIRKKIKQEKMRRELEAVVHETSARLTPEAGNGVAAGGNRFKKNITRIRKLLARED